MGSQSHWITEVLHMYCRSLQGKYSLAQLWTLVSRYLWIINLFWTPLNLLHIYSPVYFKSLSFSLIQWYRTHIAKYFKIPCYHTLLLIKLTRNATDISINVEQNVHKYFYQKLIRVIPYESLIFQFFVWEEMLSF